MKIVVDRRVYSDSCISNTLYWFGDKYSCSRIVSSDNEETISIVPMNVVEPDLFIENKFWSIMNDYKLREVVKEETKDIRTILYLKAFSNIDELTPEEIDEI